MLTRRVAAPIVMITNPVRSQSLATLGFDMEFRRAGIRTAGPATQRMPAWLRESGAQRPLPIV